MRVTKLDRERLLALADFIARHNAPPARHVASLADTPEAIREELAGFGDKEFCACAAYDGQALAGVFVAEYDLGMARAWLKGPIVAAADPTAWRAAAAALLQAIETLLPEPIAHVQFFFDERALLHAEFAREQGFVPKGDASLSLVLELRGAELERRREVIALPPELRADFAVLHETTFPGAYFTSEQLLELSGPARWLFVHRDGASLAGYICGSVSVELREAYVDFLGVREARRGNGIGAALMSSAAHELRALHGAARLRLTVRSTNEPAVRLYTKLGMHSLRSMRAFERARRR